MRHQPWWPGAVIYQIYPRSFFDSNGDGIGDLAGVTAKLDYVASLGVDAIWLSPFFVSPMRDFGYDVADHCAVDPAFGALEDFDRLLARAHALGLRLIIDLVCGHTSDEHPWFRDSRSSPDHPRADWYVWADAKPDGTPPNNWLSVFGGSAWRWEARRRRYYLHHFLPSQPSLNLRHPAVVEAMLAQARFWLDRGVDGFRLDAIDFLLHDPAFRDNPPRPPENGVMPVKPFGLQHHLHDMMQPELPALLTRLRQLIDRRPGTVLLGEVSSQDGAYERIARYTGGDDALHLAYTLRPMRGGDAGAAVRQALLEIAAAGDRGNVCWSFSNHDVERVASRWGAPGGATTPAQIRLLMMLLVSLRGSICLYQGEELGLTEAALQRHELHDPFGIEYFPEFRGRDGSRTPLPWRADVANAGFTTGSPWLPIPAEHIPLSISEQEADRASSLQSWRDLLTWRKRHPALIAGNLILLDVPAPVIGFARACAEERLFILFNPSATPIRVPLTRFGSLVPVDDIGATALLDGEFAVLPPYGAFVAAPREEALRVGAMAQAAG
jgi:alpha-glucosidase